MNHKKRLASIVSKINIMIASGILVFAVLAYFGSFQIIKQPSFQLLMIFSAGFLLCYIASYCYVLTRSIETQVIGDILLHAEFAKFLHKNTAVSVIFLWIMTAGLWLPILFYCHNMEQVPVHMMFFVAWVILWIAFTRAVDYAEEKTQFVSFDLEFREQKEICVYALLIFLFSFFAYDFLLLFLKVIQVKLTNDVLLLSNQILLELMISGVGLFFILLVGVIYFRYSKKMKAIVEKMQLEKQIEQGQLYITLLSAKYNTLQQYQHDYKKHLAYIQRLARCNESNEIDSYINAIYEGLNMHALIKLTENQTLDLILSEKFYQAKESDVVLKVDYQLLDRTLNIVAPDLCVVLENLCDNAITAAAMSEAKEVELNFYEKSQYYAIVECKNSCKALPVLKDGVPIAKSRLDGHGYGIQNILFVVKKYGGEYYFTCDAVQNIFVAKLLLPCKMK